MTDAKRWKKILSRTLIGLVFLILLVGAGVYLAIHTRPEFYEQSLEISPARQREASEEMVRKATSLYNEVGKVGRWHALMTEQEINGWLAVDLVENHPEVLPNEVREPRVRIHPDRVELAAQVDTDQFEGVLHATFEVTVPEPNMLAFRLIAFRLGRLPVSRRSVVDELLQVVRWDQFDAEILWDGGDPLLRVQIPISHKKHLIGRIETIKLDDGEVFVSGSTEKRTP